MVDATPARVDLWEMTPGILLFGKLKDAFAADRIALPEGVTTAAALRAKLVELHPELASLLGSQVVRVVVNQVVVVEEAAVVIAPADEVALLPPLSGG